MSVLSRMSIFLWLLSMVHLLFTSKFVLFCGIEFHNPFLKMVFGTIQMAYYGILCLLWGFVTMAPFIENFAPRLFSFWVYLFHFTHRRFILKWLFLTSHLTHCPAGQCVRWVSGFLIKKAMLSRVSILITNQGGSKMADKGKWHLVTKKFDKMI